MIELVFVMMMIKDGDKVTYEVEDTPKGPSAINVKIQE